MTVTASSLLLCDRVHEDPSSKNLTALGIFTGLQAKRFPTPARLMGAYVMLAGTPGEVGEIILECTEVTTGNRLFKESRRDQIGQNGKRHVHILFGKFSFPRPGAYQFTLRFNDQVVAEQTVFLKEGS